MANLNLKNIPDDFYDLLKQSAIANRCSINSEFSVFLENHFLPQRVSVDENLNRIRALRKRVDARKINVKEITNAKHPGRA